MYYAGCPTILTSYCWAGKKGEGEPTIIILYVYHLPVLFVDMKLFAHLVI